MMALHLRASPQHLRVYNVASTFARFVSLRSASAVVTTSCTRSLIFQPLNENLPAATNKICHPEFFAHLNSSLRTPDDSRTQKTLYLCLCWIHRHRVVTNTAICARFSSLKISAIELRFKTMCRLCPFAVD